MLSAAPVPQAERTARSNSSTRAISSTDGQYFSSTSGYMLTALARSSAGSRSISSHPVGMIAMNGNVSLRINARVRSGRVAANTMAAAPPSPSAKRTAFPKPAASMTASISAARSSSVRTCGTGSDSPTPALSNRSDATERGELIAEGLEFGQGPAQLDVANERRDADQLDRPVAEHLIRQAQIAARCVQRVRHGMSVLLTPPLAGARVIVPRVLQLSDCSGGWSRRG